VFSLDSLNVGTGQDARASPIWRYVYLVRVKTSITLPEELISRLDRVDKNRSALLERAAVAYLALLDRQKRDHNDIEIIDRNANQLNREAMDTLGYQQTPMNRGEFYLVRKPGSLDPRKQRVFVIVSRQVLVDSGFRL
jgi:hypothetical protein